MNRDCIKLTRKYPIVAFAECGRTGKKQNLLDLKVYSSNRAMRTIYSSKTGSEDSCFTPCAGFEGRELEEWWLVHTEKWDYKLEQQLANTRGRRMTPKTYNKKAFQRVMQSPTVPYKPTEARLQLAKRLEKYFQEQQKDGTITHGAVLRRVPQGWVRASRLLSPGRDEQALPDVFGDAHF